MNLPDLVFHESGKVATMDVETPPPGEGHDFDPVPHGMRQANARGLAAIGVQHAELGNGTCRFTFHLRPLASAKKPR